MLKISRWMLVELLEQLNTARLNDATQSGRWEIRFADDAEMNEFFVLLGTQAKQGVGDEYLSVDDVRTIALLAREVSYTDGVTVQFPGVELT